MGMNEAEQKNHVTHDVDWPTPAALNGIVPFWENVLIRLLLYGKYDVRASSRLAPPFSAGCLATSLG